ncbi:MAG: NAD-glutamate dehydrogenase domain-containing protein [Egibacteraceae bacterium]
MQPLWDRIDELLPPRQAGLAKALAQASYRLTSGHRLRELDLDAAVRGLGEALRLIDLRPAGAVGLRVGPEGQGGGTLVEVHLNDTPFLLTTVKAALEQLRLEPVDVIHPVFGVRRDGEGRLLEILPARGARRLETYLRLRSPRRLDPRGCADVRGQLTAALDDVRRATRDYERMSERLESVAAQTRASAGSRYDRNEVDEVIDLIAWLRQDRFVMLGFAAYDVVDGGRRIRPGSGLGILDDDDAASTGDRTGSQRLLVVSRTRRLSTVHRRVPMVAIAVAEVRDGAVVGEHLLLGLYAQKALAEPSSAIPVLRRKLQRIVEDQDLVEGSHDERALRGLFEALGKHELFETGPAQLGRALVELLETSTWPQPRVLLRPEPARRSVSALVAVPMERFSETVLLAIQRLLDRRLGGRSGDYRLTLTDWDMALLSFYVDDVTEAPGDRAELERQVAALIRTFHDRLDDALAAARGPAAAREAMDRWGPCLPGGYTDRTDVVTALEDVGELERLMPGAVAIAVRPDRTGQAGVWHVRLYRPGPSVEPSRVLPLLESMGLAVIEEVPHRLVGTPLGEVHIHDYAVRAARDLDDGDGDGDGARVARAALALWEGRAEVDSLNRLVVRAGVEWEDVALLRAYRRCRRQLGMSYTESYANDALVEYPDVARALLDRFAARLAPDPPEPEEQALQRVESALKAVERLDQDRILRGFLNLIDATLRTNRWRTAPRARALALKLDSRLVAGMPKPVPSVEIWVYSPLVEGVHMRGGAVARGGLRWSDRVEDFRTEVLSLMKAQMTKNAVIVPTGSKGGFVVKRPPPDPAELRWEVQLQYETYVRALLDVTDNVAGGQVVHPRGVRVRDGEDPYLVVAADRGTATFSDTANAIAEEYGFWLGDAFASGGSHGYDHKAMGITAQGAWVAVRRHFRELGIDVQTEPITVVGVGDMSGDVFGNGLLRSRTLKLVAAFDHRDIFLDPDPDPSRAYEERRRLFELPGSSWQGYRRDLISAGGGVWRRTAVQIPLTEPARQLLGVDAEQLSPPELIQAILGARVDLLFFGGIGTFVKASRETHADVGDRANDELRIDASRVRARVISEGANLGITQPARIEYSLRGGRCNTDFVDNAAGVDTSDHEVNLKILLALASEAGTMGLDERDAVLRAMQDDVGRAAVRDVCLQTWAISQELAFSPGGMGAYEELMADLVAAGRLDRAVEALPTTEEIQRRRAARAGLARPEVAVLLAHAKVDLVARLLDSPLPDQPYLQDTLPSYFPPLAAERFGDLFGRHRLRRELVATVVANDVINRMGVTWVSRTARELGCSWVAAVSAYWTAREVAGADGLYRSVEALDEHVEPLLAMEIEGQIDQLLDTCARGYIRHVDADGAAAAVARDRPAFRELENTLLSGAGHAAGRALAQRYEDLGVDPRVAQRVALLADLQLVPDVAAVARVSGQPVPRVWEVFVRLASALPLDVLRQRLRQITPRDQWERWQHRGLLDELGEHSRTAAAHAIAEHPSGDPAEIVSRFLSQRDAPRQRVTALIRMLSAEPDLHAVAVVVRALHDVCQPVS